MKARGWRVYTVDNNPEFKPDKVEDIRCFAWDGDTPDLIWASPPCTEFARESMPWCRTGETPDLTCVFAAMRLVAALKPKYWVLENVRGAQRWIGRAPAHYGSRYLWGWYPPFNLKLKERKKESYYSTDEAKRSFIPYELSEAVAIAVERKLIG